MLIKNTAIFFAGEIFGRGGKLLSIYMIAILLSKAEFGRYSFALSVCMVVLVFLDFGLNSLVMLRTTWKRYEHLLPQFLLTKFVVTGTVCVVLILCQLAFGIFDILGRSVFLPILLLCIGWDWQAFTCNALRARLNFIAELWIKVVGNLGFIVVLAIAIALSFTLNVGTTLWLQASVTVMSGCLGILWIVKWLPHWVPPRHAARGLKAIILIGAPLTLAASASVLHMSIDSIVLGTYGYLEANASFSLVQKMGQLTQLPVQMLISATLPYLVHQLKGAGRRPKKGLLDKIVILLIVIGLAAAQLFVVTSEWALPFVLGPQYNDIAFYGAVIGLYIIPLYVYSVFCNLLCVMRNVIAAQAVLAVATVLSLIVDILAVKLYGPFSVAWVTVAINWLLCIAFTALYRVRIGEWPTSWLGVSLVIFGTATVMAPQFIWAGASGMETSFRIAVAFVAFAVAGYILFRERKIFWQLLKS